MQWLRDYLECTSQTIAPEVFRYWCGVSVLAAALGRRTYIKVTPDHDPHHGWRLKPNFYIFLVGLRDSGKSVAVRQARDMMRDCGLPIAADISSRASFYETMEENDGELYVVPGELGVFLHGTSVGKVTADNDLIQSLCLLWDLEDKFTYRSRNGAKVDMDAPFLSILGGITPHALHRMLPAHANDEGLLSRVLIVTHTMPVFKAPDARLDIHMRNDLLTRLNKLRATSGTVAFSTAATEAYHAWNVAAHERAKADNMRTGARMQDYVTRLAAVHAAADASRVVTADHFAVAVKALNEILPGMQTVMRGSRGNVMSPVIDDLMQRLRRHGAMRREEFYEIYMDYGTVKQLEQVIHSVCRAGWATEAGENGFITITDAAKAERRTT